MASRSCRCPAWMSWLVVLRAALASAACGECGAKGSSSLVGLPRRFRGVPRRRRGLGSLGPPYASSPRNLVAQSGPRGTLLRFTAARAEWVRGASSDSGLR